MRYHESEIPEQRLKNVSMIRCLSNMTTVNQIGRCLASSDLDASQLAQLKKTISAENFNWERFLLIANNHWLSPYLQFSFEKANLLDNVPDNVLTELQAVRDLVDARNQRIKSQLKQIIRVLNQKDIRPLLLKGASYLMQPVSLIQNYRMTSDIDLLIPIEMINRTIETLKNDQYSFMGLLPDGTDYHLDPLIKKDAPARIELHIQPLSNSSKALINTENAWNNSELIEQENLHYYIFKPEFRVLHQFTHAQIHSRDHANERLDLRQLFDFYLMSKTYSKTINWSLIDNRFSKHHKQIWIDYVSIANHLFNYTGQIKLPASIELYLRTKKSIAKLNAQPNHEFLYHWLERSTRLPHRLTKPGWYSSKLRYILNK